MTALKGPREKPCDPDDEHRHGRDVGEPRCGGGFALGSRAQLNDRELEEFLAGPRVHTVDVTRRTAFFYARIYPGLRRKARPIPENDMWIAASAMEHGLQLLSFGRHFEEIDGLALRLL